MKSKGKKKASPAPVLAAVGEGIYILGCSTEAI